MIGAFLILASISIILNKFVNIICFSLAVLLLIFILTIHIPGLFNTDPKFAQTSLIELLKDTGLMGSAILIAVFYTSKKTENSKD
jgi:hypothetical protein